MNKKVAIGLAVVAVGAVAGAATYVAKKVTVTAATETAEAIVQEWAPIILSELGIGNAENILNKITVSDEVLEEYKFGDIAYQCLSRGSYFKRDRRYNPNSASISIYAENIKAKRFNKLLKFGVRNKAYKTFVLFTLAHELRHFHQLITGSMFENEIFIGNVHAMPYEHRWCETDANEFADMFVEKYKDRI